MVRYQRQWEFPSRSNPTKTYTVSLTMDGQYICHCWPYLNNRNQPCRHIHSVMATFRPAQALPVPISQGVTRHTESMSIWDNGLDAAFENGE